jgi:hypothetical protein
MIRTPQATTARRSMFTTMSESPLITSLRRSVRQLTSTQQEPAQNQVIAVSSEGHFTDELIPELSPPNGNTSQPSADLDELAPSPRLALRAERRVEEIRASLPPPLVPTPISSPQSSPTVSPSATARMSDEHTADQCRKCQGDISTDRKAVMCNFCKCWLHRTCLHPSFLDRDVTVVKKDYVLIICQDCSSNRLHLLSSIPPSSGTQTFASKAAQCDMIRPPPNVPLSDAQTQATNEQQNQEPDVQILEDLIPQSNQAYAPRSDYYIIQGIDDPCSNLYQFSFEFNRPSQNNQVDHHNFSSLEQCYKFFRVLPHDNNLAEEILREDCPYKIMKLAKRCEERRTPEDVELMTEMVKAKVGQCRAFRDTMRAALAMNLKFLHSTYPSDNIFGSGLHHSAEQIPLELPGQNILGKIVTACANSLKPESEYLSTTSVEFVNGNAVVLHDGERLPINNRQQRPHKPNPLPPWKRPTNPIPPWKRHPRKAYPTWAGGVQFRAPQSQPVNQRGNMSHICFHCSVPGHTMRDCRLRHVKVICHACNREGHKRRYCTFTDQIPRNRPTHGAAPARDPQLQPEPQHHHVQNTVQPHADDMGAARDLRAHMPAMLNPGFVSYPDASTIANVPFYAHPSMLPPNYYQNFPPLPTTSQPNF